MSLSIRICFFGDSFTNGTGDDDCLGWVGRICAAARQKGRDITSYNLGVRRNTSADIARRWRAEAEARLPPQYDGRLVFSFGSNDGYTNDDGKGPRLQLEESLKNARSILQIAHQWRPTLMLGPMPVSDFESDQRIRSLSESLEILCTELGIPYLNLFRSAVEISRIWHTELVAGDGVHPNRRSYQAIAQVIDRWPAWRAWID